MKLQVTRENLNKALGSVAKTANSRGTLPILANVLIKTNKNRLSLAATNLDIAITHSIGAKVTSDGSTTVPARLMQDFISSLPDGVINLELKETKLNITTDQYQSSVNGVIADDFPAMPAISSGQKWSLGTQDFKRALQQVVFAASNDETRPILTGVLLQSVGGKLSMAATDSYRLAEKQLGNTKQDINLLIPATALQDLQRIIGDEEGELSVTYDDQQALFKVGDIELVTRLLEGNYPDYHKLIPPEFATKITLKKADLNNVTKVSSLFARESAGSVTIEVDGAKNQLSIKSVASQLGENTATANGKASGSGSITLNSRYLLEALGIINDDQVTFAFNGKLEPTLLTGASSPDYKHIIMPLKG